MTKEEKTAIELLMLAPKGYYGTLTVAAQREQDAAIPLTLRIEAEIDEDGLSGIWQSFTDIENSHWYTADQKRKNFFVKFRVQKVQVMFKQGVSNLSKAQRDEIDEEIYYRMLDFMYKNTHRKLEADRAAKFKQDIQCGVFVRGL